MTLKEFWEEHEHGIVLSSLVIMLFLFLLFGAVDMHHLNGARDTACKVQGYKEYEYFRMWYCKDHNNNLHYADFECKGVLWTRTCKATLISVGDVRVVGG